MFCGHDIRTKFRIPNHGTSFHYIQNAFMLSLYIQDCYDWKICTDSMLLYTGE